LRVQRYAFFATLANFSATILLDNTLLDEDFLQDYHRAVYLLLSMCGHQGIAHERV